MAYHTTPTAIPAAALNQKEARQPWWLLIHVSTGMLKPAPVPTPAKIQPFARPRSATGIHRATNWLEAG